jgi:2-oxo-4-hydroxy-4-carboxy--5-ureidoimidazoline (OHCU) decarboxylase
MSLAPPNSTLFGLHDPMMTAWRAAANDRQGARLRGHREIDSKVANKEELGGKPDLTDASRAGCGDLGLARWSDRTSARFEPRDDISPTPSRQRTIKGRKNG